MIKLFKFVNGETIICDAEKNLDSEWVVTRPFTLMIVPQHGGSMGVVLVDYIVGAKDDYSLVLKPKDLISDAIEPDIQMMRMWDAKMAEILKRDTGIEVISRI